MNRRTGKPFILSNRNVKDWQKNALEQLKDFPHKFTMPVRIDYVFYVKDNRARDLDNMIATINDILQVAGANTARTTSVKNKSGIISGDHWQVLEIGSAVAQIDKEYPRAVITITPLQL